MKFAAPWGRLVELVGWGAMAGGGSVMLTQAVGWDGFRVLATLQALTPYLLPLLAIVGGVALWQQRRPLAASASAVGIAALLLATPIAFPPAQASMMEGANGLRVASVNLLYSNQRIDDVADDLLGRDLDVIVFIEYTSTHQRGLLAHELAAVLPHRVQRDLEFSGEVSVWSRFAISGARRPDVVNSSVDLTIDGPDGVVRILAVHSPTPVFDFSGWRSDLAMIADLGSTPGPATLVIGDFNSSYWHPAFRDVLGHGLTDAHMANGRGWSTSWPTDQFIPPFVRLDHALTGNGLVSTAVEDFRVPGSDHLGFVVSVAPVG